MLTGVPRAAMGPTYPKLSRYLDEAGTDGYLLDAEGEDSTQRYLSGFHAPLSFVTLYTDGEIRLLVPDLEYRRASEESDAEGVHRHSEFDFGSKVVEHGERRAGSLVTAAFLTDRGVDSVSVPPSFPTGTATVLREQDIEVVVDLEAMVDGIRAVKTDEEVGHIAAVQRVNEEAMAAAEAVLERTTVKKGVLYLDGDVLTSERVRRTIETTVEDQGCTPCECIVASGPEAARGHAIGSGPIRAGEPIVVDIAPRDEASGYVGDMTRTLVKGEPSARIEEWYDLTGDAFQTALAAIEPGVTGEAVNDAVCEVFERAGYPTRRTNEATETGFVHNTGHGVGLDLHEQPKLSWGHGELRPGNVVTVEPGLYDPDVGGVRLEDIVVVTESGHENLNDYPRDLRVV